MPNLPILSLTTGEVTPLIDARSDVSKYTSACRILENMIPRIYGVAGRRPGTKFIKLTQNPNALSRLLPFIYSEEIAYMTEWGDQGARFYFDGGALLDGNGVHVGISTPYLAADLRQIQYKQSNDVMWLVHKDYIPRKLTRTTATSFTLGTITFTGGPFLKRNDLDTEDGVTITPSVTTGSGTLTASADTFEIAHVGSLWKLTHARVNTSITGSRSTAGILGTPMVVEGIYTFSTGGTWKGTVLLQRSEDAGVSWETVKTYTQQALLTKTESGNNVQYRINVTALTSGKITATLSVNSSEQDGIARVTGWTSATEVSMDVEKDFASTDATKKWAEGAWSGVRGYPRAMAFFEERAIYAGTANQPQTIWASASGLFECFSEGTADSDSFSLTLSSDTRNAILWITGLEALLFGTSGGEWRLRSSRFDEPLTPTNYSIKQQTTKGSKPIQALQIDSAVMFVDSVGRKVREMTLDQSTGEKYVANDMNALAEHITKTGIVEIAHQKNPDSIMWAVRQDGVLLSMTYEREQNVIGWARHPFDTGGASDTSSEDGGYKVFPTYPTLRELEADLIPVPPAAPIDTPLTNPIVDGIPIFDAEGLQNISGANHYRLTENIDLTGVGWTPLPNFSGILDGDGYTILNLTINRPTSDDQAFFANLSTNAEIRNLNFLNCSVTGEDYVAILAAQFDDAANNILLKNITITNCSLNGRFMVGAFVGKAEEAYSCKFYDNDVTNLTITFDGASSGYYGGFLGMLTSDGPKGKNYFVRCAVQGSISVTSSSSFTQYIAGFIGMSAVHQDDDTSTTYYHECHASVSITCTGDTFSFIGGFVGKFVANDVISCHATGDINIVLGSEYSNGYWVGGFFGACEEHQNIINSYATGDITIDTTGQEEAFYGGSVGGFVGMYWTGWSNCKMLRCYSTGNITVGSIELAPGFGGFIGQIKYNNDVANNVIERCWSEGDVNIEEYGAITAETKSGIGGFIGLIYFSDITAEIIDHTIRNCYAWGSILYADNNQELATGGFIGTHYTNQITMTLIIDNCYNAQTDIVEGSGLSSQLASGEFTNGFIGYVDSDNPATVTDSFWDRETSSILTDNFAVKHLTDWMQLKENFEAAGWDLETIWFMRVPSLWKDEHNSNGLGINSVAVIPGDGEDEVWVIIGRVINGHLRRTVEQMQPRDFGVQEDAWFSDSALDYDGVATSVFEGLGHLEGEEVVIWGNGAIFTRKTVTDGTVALDSDVTRAIVGLPNRYILKAMRFDLQARGGTSKGSKKKIAKVWISFFESILAKYGKDVDHLLSINWRTVEPYDSPPAMFTGDKKVVADSGFDSEDGFIITGDDPAPCTVRAIVLSTEVTE